MIKLELSDEIENRHLEYFKKKIYPKFDSKFKFLNYNEKKLHNQFMNLCKENVTELAIGKPQLLRKFVLELSPEIKDLISQNKKYNKKLLEIFGYEEFCRSDKYISDELLTQDNYKQSNNKLKNHWNPYSFLMLSNIRVCPYCNREYITPIYIQSKRQHHKLRADLDHFYSKSKYPYLSMSLYNLVPCCKFCNSSLKNVKEFDINDINPYEENFDDYFKFRTDILCDSNIYIEKTRPSKRIDRYLDCFQIKALYNYNKNQAKELIKKRLIYSESYIDELYESNKSYFRNKSEIKQLLIGYIADKNCINDEAFSKFRRDIAEQLHFIDYEPDEKLIKKLKTIINK